MLILVRLVLDSSDQGQTVIFQVTLSLQQEQSLHELQEQVVHPQGDMLAVVRSREDWIDRMDIV